MLVLARDADVFIESFRAGALERMGLGYAAVRDLNPDIIYCSISGYGRTGPLADKPGYDLLTGSSSRPLTCRRNNRSPSLPSWTRFSRQSAPNPQADLTVLEADLDARVAALYG